MENYAIDADVEQVIRWLLTEQGSGGRVLRISARRAADMWETPVRIDWWMDEEEREDPGGRIAIAVLEITPLQADEGWCLKVTVEDEAGRLGDESSADRWGGDMRGGDGQGGDAEGTEEEPIDLATFYEEFIRPHKGTARLTADLDGREAEARLARLLSAIEGNSHSPDDGLFRG